MHTKARLISAHLPAVLIALVLGYTDDEQLPGWYEVHIHRTVVLAIQGRRRPRYRSNDGQLVLMLNIPWRHGVDFDWADIRWSIGDSLDHGP